MLSAVSGESSSSIPKHRFSSKTVKLSCPSSGDPGLTFDEHGYGTEVAALENTQGVTARDRVDRQHQAALVALGRQESDVRR